MRVIRFLLCMALAIGVVRADIVADIQQRISVVDDAINAAEDAWVKASAQVKALKAAIDSLDPNSQEHAIAVSTQTELSAQIDQLSAALDQLHAKRLQLAWSLTVYQQAVATKQLEDMATAKINDYKKSYTGQITSMSNQFKVIEDGIAQIKGILEDTDFTDAKNVAASDARGRVQGALTGLQTSLSSLSDIDTKIASDMPDVQKISQTIAADFATWWQQQKDWAAQTKTALANRSDILKDFDAKLAAKQQDYQAYLAKKTQLDAAAALVAQKKSEALAVFKSLVQARAQIIQQMSDLVGVISSSLGVADQAITSATADKSLGGVLSQAQDITNNMTDIGEFQRIFVQTEDSLAAAYDQMNSLFAASELADIKKSITDQSTWMKGFAATLQALRDQSANIRKKLDDKRNQLAQAAANQQSQNAAVYAASIQQLIQIITQVRSEGESVVRNVLTPLVLGVSQKVVSLSALFDVQDPTSDSLQKMKSAIDDVANDCAQVDASINEFNLWSKMIDQYGAMIKQQFTDTNLQTTLTSIQKDFVDWNTWATGVGTRQQAIKKTIDMANSRYTALTTSVKSAQDASYALDLSLKQTLAAIDALTQKKTPVDAQYQKVLGAIDALKASADADALLTQWNDLNTAVSGVEKDAKSAQTLVNGLVPSTTPQAVATKYADQVKKVQDSMSALAAAVQKLRNDTDALKDKIANKKTSLAGAEAAAKEADATKQAAMLAAQKAQDATAQSLATFVGGAKQEVLDIASFKKDLDAFSARIDAAKTPDAVTALVNDFSSSKSKFKTLQDTITSLLTNADAVQKSFDQDKAAGRIVTSDAVQSLTDQKAQLVKAQTDIAAFVKIMDDTSKKLDSLSGDVQKRGAALDDVNRQKTAVAQKITAFGSYFDRIKAAIAAAQDTMSNGADTAAFDGALAKLAEAENLKGTIATDKTNNLAPALDALTKTAVPNFTKSFGDLPADVSGDINNQVSWVGAVDSSVNSFMDTIAALKPQLVTKRDQLSQDDLKTFGAMTFAKQMQALEDIVPNTSTATQVAAVMRKVDYVVQHRYGSHPEDKDPNVINANKARLLRFIDWVSKNTRFASKKSVLVGYRQNVAG